MQAIVDGRRGASAEEISWMVTYLFLGIAGDVLFGSQRSALRLHDLILSAREIRSQVRRLCHQHKLTLKNTQVHIVKPGVGVVCAGLSYCIFKLVQTDVS